MRAPRIAVLAAVAVLMLLLVQWTRPVRTALVNRATHYDVSPPLLSLRVADVGTTAPDCEEGCGSAPREEEEEATQEASPANGAAGAAVEQKSQGARPPAVVIVSFDGLGADFAGPQGTATLRNPSDNSLAVGM